MAATTLVASTTTTATGTDAITAFSENQIMRMRGAIFMLEVTAAGTTADDKLDYFLQYSLDGTNFTDFVAFAQVSGADTGRWYARWIATGALPPEAVSAETDAGIAAGTVLHGPSGGTWRGRAVITDDTDPTFTYNLTCEAVFEPTV